MKTTSLYVKRYRTFPVSPLRQRLVIHDFKHQKGYTYTYEKTGIANREFFQSEYKAKPGFFWDPDIQVRNHDMELVKEIFNEKRKFPGEFLIYLKQVNETIGPTRKRPRSAN